MFSNNRCYCWMKWGFRCVSFKGCCAEWGDTFFAWKLSNFKTSDGGWILRQSADFIKPGWYISQTHRSDSLEYTGVLGCWSCNNNVPGSSLALLHAIPPPTSVHYRNKWKKNAPNSSRNLLEGTPCITDILQLKRISWRKKYYKMPISLGVEIEGKWQWSEKKRK